MIEEKYYLNHPDKPGVFYLTNGRWLHFEGLDKKVSIQISGKSWRALKSIAVVIKKELLKEEEVVFSHESFRRTNH